MNVILIFATLIVGLAIIGGVISLVAEVTAGLRSPDPLRALLVGMGGGALLGVLISFLLIMGAFITFLVETA